MSPDSSPCCAGQRTSSAPRSSTFRRQETELTFRGTLTLPAPFRIGRRAEVDMAGCSMEEKRLLREGEGERSGCQPRVERRAGRVELRSRSGVFSSKVGVGGRRCGAGPTCNKRDDLPQLLSFSAATRHLQRNSLFTALADTNNHCDLIVKVGHSLHQRRLDRLCNRRLPLHQIQRQTRRTWLIQQRYQSRSDILALVEMSASCRTSHGEERT